MSEKFIEGKEGGELTHEHVVMLLRENQSDLAPLIAYVSKRQREVEANDGGGLTLTIETADIYIAAELFQAARETLLDAIDQAWGEGDSEAAEELEARLAELPPLT